MDTIIHIPLIWFVVALFIAFVVGLMTGLPKLKTEVVEAPKDPIPLFMVLPHEPTPDVKALLPDLRKASQSLHVTCRALTTTDVRAGMANLQVYINSINNHLNKDKLL